MVPGPPTFVRALTRTFTPSRTLALIATFVAAVTLLWVVSPPAGAAVLGPHKGKVFTGVSDTGDLGEFLDFAETTGKHPAVLQTFHPWGNGLDLAYKRWRNAEVRPMLHMSTADDETREELITPKEIARGSGDQYLLEINSFFATNELRAYIRPLGEPNRCRNPYAGVDCSGTVRGGHYAFKWYRSAFRRIAIIVRGGAKRGTINARLDKIGLPKVWKRSKKEVLPRKLPKAPVAMVWSPLPAGSPRVKGNWPGNYWPGKNFVDWAGADFYSNYPHWKDLNKFFRAKKWKKKPFALTEWGVAGADTVKFPRQIFSWMEKRSRVRMYNYYRGFGTIDNPYDPDLYPDATRVLRNKLKNPRYVPYAYGHARKPESSNGG
ncbi:MAG: hypothetical protein ACERKT_04495 [Acidobacteriota bacterium]